MATKRIKDLTSIATAADLLSNRYGVLDTPYITKKLPGNLLGGGGGTVDIVFFDVMWDFDDNDYIFPAAQDVINAVGVHNEIQLVFHSPAGVNYVYSITYKSALHYEWTREDCQSKFSLDGAGSPVTWTWTAGETNLKQIVGSLDTDIGKIGGSIAQMYDSSQTYSVGDYVMYERRLYECNTAITTAEEWNSAKWTIIRVADIIGNVESLLSAL